MIYDANEDKDIRTLAVRTLGLINKPEAVNGLVKIAQSQLPLIIRWAAIACLLPGAVDPKIQDSFKGEISGVFEDKLMEVILKELWKGPAGSEGIRSTEKIANLTKLSPALKAKLVPWVLLEFYRQPGNSGEFPFFASSWMKPNETEIYKFVASLSNEDLRQLRIVNTPGVMEIIETIKSNPDTFNRRVLGQENTPNPVYGHLEQSIIKACRALESPENQNYILNIFDRMWALTYMENFLSVYNPSLLKDLDKVQEVWKLWNSNSLMVRILKDPNNNHLFYTF